MQAGICKRQLNSGNMDAACSEKDEYISEHANLCMKDTNRLKFRF